VRGAAVQALAALATRAPCRCSVRASPTRSIRTRAECARSVRPRPVRRGRGAARRAVK
jgi:hypothetical protein